MAGLRGIGSAAVGGADRAQIYYQIFNLMAVFDKTLSLMARFDKNSQSSAVLDKVRAIAIVIEE